MICAGESAGRCLALEVKKTLELDEGSQQLLLDDFVALLALHEVATHLGAEVLIESLNSLDHVGEASLSGVEGADARATSDITREALCPLLQVANRADLHGVELVGVRIRLVRLHPLEEIDALLLLGHLLDNATLICGGCDLLHVDVLW